MTLQREKRNAGKPDLEKSFKQPKLRPRNTMYIPSTQKIGLTRKRKQSTDSTLLDDFEPDENKIDEIENNIFSKITESVDKIFNQPAFESRATFSGYSMLTPDLDCPTPDNRFRMTMKQPDDRHNSIEDQFQEIAEAPEEEEKETRKGTM